MTPAEFNAAATRIGSRRELCRRTGIPRRSADNYALGRTEVPRVVRLAIAAVEAGLDQNDERAA